MKRPWFLDRDEWRAFRIALRVSLKQLHDGVPPEEAKQRGLDAGEAHLRRQRLDQHG